MDTPEHRLHGDFISPVSQHLCHRLTAEFDSGFGKVKNEVVIVTNLENIQHYLIKLNFNIQLLGFLILSNFNPDLLSIVQYKFFHMQDIGKLYEAYISNNYKK